MFWCSLEFIFFDVEPSFHYKSIIKNERVDNDQKKKENPVCFSLIDSTLGKTQLDFTLTHIILIKRKKKKEYKSTKFTTSEYGQHYEIF